MLPILNGEARKGWFSGLFDRRLSLDWLLRFIDYRQETVMRKYIRHPSDIPIDFQVEEDGDAHVYNVKDVSEGGLCFKTDKQMPRGIKIHLHIPVEYQIGAHSRPADAVANLDQFEADGIVAWCKKEGDGYSVGVQFSDPGTRFGVRMVEQVCHIEHYRYDVLQAQGRELTREQAAREWVERYAAEFPAVN